jgi:predicted deacylase
MTATLFEPIVDFDPHQLPRSGVTRGWLTARVGLDGDVRLAVMVARGARPGPTALLVAGVHGDEFEGIVALGRLVGSLDPASMSGTVIALPVCNPFAFQSQSRTTPAHIDGANLARSFPGDPDGAPTSRLASALFTMATRLLGGDDLIVDLHSAGTRYRYAGLVGFRDVDASARDASEEAARHFGHTDRFRLWAMQAERGRFNAETTLAGIPTVGAEAPGQGECQVSVVDAYADGVRNLLRFKGIVDSPPPPPSLGPPARPVELVAGTDGIFVTGCTVGDQVSRGERLGTIEEPTGALRGEVLAPRSGEIVALRTFATVYADEMVAWVT